jgi:ribosome maturation factor RimP
MENDHGNSRSETRPEAGRTPKPKSGVKRAAKRAIKPRAARPPKPLGGAEIDLKTDLTAELEGIAEQAGCELVHAEWKGGTLQILIDRDGGVTLADCERVSKQTSALLDVLDFGNTRYVLEVSSPGLDRQLYRPRDYQRFVGSKARITYSSPEVRKRTLVARLEAFHSEPESVTLLDEESGERTTLRLDQIQAARLEIEL